MQVGELFVLLNFKVKENNLKTFDKGVKGLTSNLALLATALAGVGYIAERMINAAAGMGTALFNFAQQTGDSALELQKWQAAAIQANPALTVDKVTQSIQALDQALVEIRLGGGNSSPFNILGINPLQMHNAFEVLEQLRGKVTTTNRPLFANLLAKMGLDPGFINVLQLSRKEFDALTKGFVRGEAAIGSLKKMGAELATLRLRLTFFRDEVVVSMIPTIEKFINGFKELQNFASMAFKGFKAFAQDFPNTARTIAAGAALLVTSLRPLTVLVAGLLLLMADYYAYKQGGKSVTGDLMEFVQPYTKEGVDKRIDNLKREMEEERRARGGRPLIVEDLKRIPSDPQDDLDFIERVEKKKKREEEKSGIFNLFDGFFSKEPTREYTPPTGSPILPPQLPGSTSSTIINNNVNVDMTLNNADRELDNQKVAELLKKAIDQGDINKSFTDQQPKGGIY